MPKHFLLLEPNPDEAAGLARDIEAGADVIVHRAHTMREACTVLTRQVMDLAFLPVSRNDSLVYSIRMLQPDLSIVLIADDDEQSVPERQSQAVWGIVTRKSLEDAMRRQDLFGEDPSCLERLFWRPAGSPLELAEPHRIGQAELTPERLAPLAQELLAHDYLRFVMFLKGQEIIGYHTTDDQDQLVLAAEEVRALWQGGPENRTQIQFLNSQRSLDDESWLQDTLVLYTRPFGPFLMTLGARASTRVELLRRLVRSAAHRLLGHDLNGTNAHVRRRPDEPAESLKSFVLVWQPREILSSASRQMLEELLPQVAQKHGFSLDHIILNKNFVHVVASCPADRNSGWLAQTLKDDSALASRARAGITRVDWAPGYYAKPSIEPLSAAELSQLLTVQFSPLSPVR